MNIEIQGLPGGLVQNTGDSGRAGAADAAGAPAAAGGPGDANADSVRLTDSASRLQDLEGRLANLPVVDGQRVEAVRMELATGTFAVDPVRTADKVLDLERQLP